MRPLESFSIFSAQGTMKCFTGLATGGRKLCMRSVTSCAAAGVGASARPDISVPASAVRTIVFMGYPPA